MKLQLHPDRLFPSDRAQRDIARELYASVSALPIISPHGHTDPSWFAFNEPFPDAAQLLVVPDHYAFRMLVSQGARLEDLGIRPNDGGAYERDGRTIWRRFAENYYLFRGTPTGTWFDHTLSTLFGIEDKLSAGNADSSFDRINELLATDGYRPRALFERFNIEAIATTEGALDDLRHHRAIAESGWPGRVITAYRPDAVVDPDFEGFSANLDTLGDITGCDTGSWQGYLDAHRKRRDYFKTVGGATSSDHGHPSAATANLDRAAASSLFDKVRSNQADHSERALFRAQMLTEMAKMSLDDGLVMQLHCGSVRNHSAPTFARFGRDKGFDIPGPIDFVGSLKPLLDAVGMDPRLSVILFTLDETTYTRELAPLAGAYPALKLGPAWWFQDSPEGMLRFREMMTETAGFYNTVGFNDDTRAFPSIPARHDVARRIDCVYLARLVAEHRLSLEEAGELIVDLTYNLAKKAYKL
jgi:glucuronate isomerase